MSSQTTNTTQTTTTCKIYDFNAEVKNEQGKFVRTASKFRNLVKTDEFPLESDRYALILAYACPWCHRTDLVRTLKGLEEVIPVYFVDHYLGEEGWRFGHEGDQDTFSGLNAKFLKEIYLQSNPNYEGKVTVPILYDKKQHLIVNNESSEIIRMMNDQFNPFSTRNQSLDLFPSQLRSEIEKVNEWIYPNINDGVYKCGFAQKQQAYEEAFHALFKTMDELETILSKQRFVVKQSKNSVTEADLRLLPTLLRFDIVYYSHFKCNLKTIRYGYPNIYNYMKEVYQMDGGILAKTFNVEQTKKHYFGSHRRINGFGIVPLGPDITGYYDSPYHRDLLEE